MDAAAIGAAVAAVWFFLEFGEEAVSDVTQIIDPTRVQVRQALRRHAAAAGLDPEIVDAIGRVEGPYWNPTATNLVGPDGARGGAYGPTQITERTARGHGFTGDMREMFNPETAARWTAIILGASNARRPLTTPADYAAAWNAGRDDADRNNDGQLEELPEGHPTRVRYLPALLAALAYVQANPPPEEGIA